MPTTRVQVYRNLTASRKNGVTTYSVRDADTRKVIRHTQSIVLTDATFKVLESGRQRVLRTGHKNVHAWVEGTWDDDPGEQSWLYKLAHDSGVPLRYNPRVAGHFHRPEDPEAPVLWASRVLLDGSGITAILYDRDRRTCPHPEDDREAHVTTQFGRPYVWRSCAACGQEFHEPERLRAAGLRQRRERV